MRNKERGERRGYWRIIEKGEGRNGEGGGIKRRKGEIVGSKEKGKKRGEERPKKTKNSPNMKKEIHEYINKTRKRKERKSRIGKEEKEGNTENGQRSDRRKRKQ